MMGDRSRGGPGPIPKRWLHCPRKSTALIDNKFLAFKTPLDRKFDDQVPSDCVFTPELLLGSVGAYKAALGLWIDLTYTKRFYDSSRLVKKGVKYVKLECRGHGETPSEEQIKAFIHLCSQFIAQEPDKIIGVHCTHGFNRTGFLIVSYLVESEDWALDRALLEFARLRPPGIYKQDYLDELFNRYGFEGELKPVAPELPKWCFDEEDGPDEPISAPPSIQNGHQPSPGGDAQSTSQQSAFMEGISGVTQITEPGLLKSVQKKVQELCGGRNKGFPGSQPVSMDRENLAKLAAMPYMVSWKADGMRYMMLIDGPGRVFLIDRDNRVFQAATVHFPKRKDLDAHLDNTLVDGEMVIDKVNGQSIPRYLVYDIVRFGEADVGNTAFGVRLQCITKEIIEPRAKATALGKLNRAAEPFSVRLKDFFDLHCTESLLGEKFRQSLAHEPDGLVFQPKNEPYTPGRCDSVLKWKPHYMNSVDFRLKVEKTPPREGTVSVTRGLLYVGRMNEPFAQIPMTAELKKLHNKIVECHFDMTANCWKFMRERTDKSFPNDKTTAYSVCNSIQFPVTQDFLLDFIRRSAYRKPVEAPQAHRPRE